MLASSPYAENAEQFIAQLEPVFLEVFALQKGFRYADLLPGQRFGLFQPSSLKASPYPGSQMEFLTYIFELVIIVGCQDKSMATSAAMSWPLTIKNGLVAMERHPQVTGCDLVHKLNLAGEISIVPYQSTAPLNGISKVKGGQPVHPWTLDISCQVEVACAIAKDIFGRHVPISQV